MITHSHTTGTPLRLKPIITARHTSMLNYLRRLSKKGTTKLQLQFPDFESRVIGYLHLTGTINDSPDGIEVEKP